MDFVQVIHTKFPEQKHLKPAPGISSSSTEDSWQVLTSALR